jgi:origin recognition complex subunit 1
VLASTLDATRRPSAAELSLVLESLVASRAMLLEDNVAVSRKPDGERRVILNFEMIEVERVLGEVGGSTWKNVLST